MLKELIKIANELDRRGLAEESDKLDGIIQKIAEEEATYMCFGSGFSFMNKISINIRCVDVATSVIKEAVGWDSTKSEDPIADAKATIAEWKIKYPGAKWQWRYEGDPVVSAEQVGLTAADFRE
jgi:hypothetical protein